MIKVKLFFVPKNVVGKSEVSVFAKTLKGLLKKLIKEHPELKEVVFEKVSDKKELKLKNDILILINGLSKRELNTPLKKGDIVFISSAISGG
jgi:molybdopterin converting factor small subunit